MKITFYGGAESVTGSNYLLETGDLRVLIDCGLFQGSTAAEMKNYEQFPYKPADIAAVFLTHSHADHTGRLPKLFKEGFRGVVYATPPTLEMTAIALPDNLALMMDAAKKTNHPPLFSLEDLNGIMNLGQGIAYGQEIHLADGVTAVLHDAGHILGSTIVEFRTEGEKIYFSGDLGNPPTPLLRPFEYPTDADYIVVESAYGNRIHEDRSVRKEKLRSIVKDTIDRGGVLMIPSFAMERTQELLFELNAMHNAGEIPDVPIFLDSPLAIKLTEVYQRYPDYFNKDANYAVTSGDDLFNFPGLKYTRTAEESKHINDVLPPKIIIAGSGMSAGGRILHHERRYLSDSNSTLLFIGFQAEGTPGRKILDGAKDIKIFDELVPVNCRVEAIGGYSAHADQPTLLKWLAKGAEGNHLKKVFTVQGEVTSATELAELITKNLNVPAVVPTPDEAIEL
jgi:metallo-beta-lactamase family protein